MSLARMSDQLVAFSLKKEDKPLIHILSSIQIYDTVPLDLSQNYFLCVIDLLCFPLIGSLGLKL